MKKDITPDISRKRVKEIEEQCRKMRSDAIVNGFMLLLSAQLFKDREIALKPADEDKPGECAA